MWKIVLINCIFLTVSFRFFLLNKVSCVGHHWDWHLPCNNGVPEAFMNYDRYVWVPLNLGGAGALGLTQVPVNLIVRSVMHLKSQFLAFYALILILSSISLVYYSKLLGGKRPQPVHIVMSLLYVYSPYIYNDIIGGSLYLWVGYYLIPAFTHFTVEYMGLENKPLPNLTLLLFLQLFITSTVHFAFYSNIIFMLVALYNLLRLKRYRVILTRAIIYLVAYLMLNLYWLLPFLALMDTFNKNTLQGVAFNAQHLKSIKQNLITVPGLYGYLDRNMYIHSLRWIQKLIVALSITALLCAGVYRRRKSEINTLLVMIALLATLMIVKGGNIPYSNLSVEIFNSLPFMKVFRSPQRLMFIPSLLIPIIITKGITEVENKKKYMVTSFLLLAWVSGWWLKGDLGMRKLQSEKRDSVDTFTVEPGLAKILDTYRKSIAPYRILFVPADMSPYYLSNRYQNHSQGAASEHLTLGNVGTFWLEGNPDYYPIDEFFCKSRGFDLVGFLSLYNTKEILLRKDLMPAHTVCTPFNSTKWRSGTAEQKLDNLTGIRKVETGETFARYVIENNLTNERFYIPKTLIKIGNMKDIFHMEKIDQYSAYIDTDYPENIANGDGHFVKSIRYNDPTNFEVYITGDASSVIPLVFSERYDPNWIIVNSPEGTIHSKVNNYANMWVIDLRDYCDMNKSLCTKTGVKLKVVFKIQELAVQGLRLGIFGLCVIYLLPYASNWCARRRGKAG